MFTKSKKVNIDNRDNVHRRVKLLQWIVEVGIKKKKDKPTKVREGERGNKVFCFYLLLYNIEEIKPSIYYHRKWESIHGLLTRNISLKIGTT